jgi:hypothetical protein
MDETEQTLVQRHIATLLDCPSVHMGSPSRMSMAKAQRIVNMLLRERRLVATTCDHGAWTSYAEHGSRCPNCSTVMREYSPTKRIAL